MQINGLTGFLNVPIRLYGGLSGPEAADRQLTSSVAMRRTRSVARNPNRKAVRAGLAVTEYRVRAVMLKLHPMIPSIPRARKFVAEKKVRILFFIPVWREVDDLILWYHTAEEAWEAIRRDAERADADESGEPPAPH